MKKIFVLLLSIFSLQVKSALPPAEKFLPQDTLVLITWPDIDTLTKTLAETPMFWKDESMQPFMNKFLSKITNDLTKSFEKKIGINCSDFTNLFHGQITFAAINKPSNTKQEHDLDWVLLIDTKNQSNQLKTITEKAKKKLNESEIPVKTEKIRNVEFLVTTTFSSNITKSFMNTFSMGQDSDEDEDSEDEKTNSSATNKQIIKSTKPSSTNVITIYFGQLNDVFIAGNASSTLEKILAKIDSSSSAPALNDNPIYNSYTPMFKDSFINAWLNLSFFIDIIKSNISSSANENSSEKERFFSALGLTGIKAFGLAVKKIDNGFISQALVNVPESERKGLTRLFLFEAKDASPPDFVPSDVIKFQRVRLDGAKTWQNLEKMISEISPDLSKFITDTISMVGKDKDPTFDLRKQLIDNLGNDIIFWQKEPKNPSVTNINNTPTVFLIGSSNPNELIKAFRISMEIAMPMANIKERDFQGSKIYSISIPFPNQEINPGKVNQSVQNLYFTSSKNYLSVATEEYLIEEFLRNITGASKPLSQTPGLSDAAQKVGGMSTGYFGFQNNASMFKMFYTVLKNHTDLMKPFEILFPSIEIKDWIDVSLLPPFEKIEKYFNFVVYSAKVEPNGFLIQSYSPLPAAK